MTTLGIMAVDTEYCFAGFCLCCHSCSVSQKALYAQPRYAECSYAECSYAEWRYAECRLDEFFHCSIAR